MNVDKKNTDKGKSPPDVYSSCMRYHIERLGTKACNILNGEQTEEDMETISVMIKLAHLQTSAAILARLERIERLSDPDLDNDVDHNCDCQFCKNLSA